MLKGWIFIDDTDEFRSRFEVLFFIEEPERFLEQSVVFFIFKPRVEQGVGILASELHIAELIGEQCDFIEITAQFVLGNDDFSGADGVLGGR